MRPGTCEGTLCVSLEHVSTIDGSPPSRGATRQACLGRSWIQLPSSLRSPRPDRQELAKGTRKTSEHKTWYAALPTDLSSALGPAGVRGRARFCHWGCPRASEAREGRAVSENGAERAHWMARVRSHPSAPLPRRPCSQIQHWDVVRHGSSIGCWILFFGWMIGGLAHRPMRRPP